MTHNSKNKGFTLIEILLVVAAIAILAGIVILAINPNKQLGDTRNAQRSADVRTILDAVYQYALDNNGTLPSSITTSSNEICQMNTSCSGISLDVLTTNSKYLVSIPLDPQSASSGGTDYFIYRTADNRVTVSAPGAEDNATIRVTR